jgi:general secretion pathway protein C
VTEQVAVILPWQRMLLVIGKLIFTVLIASQLAVFTWMILSPFTLVLIEPSRATGTINKIQTDSIADLHVFGDTAAVVVKEVPKEIDAPKTRLRLELLGVMVTNKAEESSAIIAAKGKDGEYYKVGDTVQGRTKLADVQQDKVILDNSGKLETLKFDLTDKPQIKKSNKPVLAPGTLKDKFKRIRTASDAVTLLREEVTNNPAGALKQLGLETSDNGAGYKVTSSQSLLTQLGLQAGDVILSVNGQTLGNVDDDQMLIEQVASSGQARLEIQRGNRRFVVNHTIK